MNAFVEMPTTRFGKNYTSANQEAAGTDETVLENPGQRPLTPQKDVLKSSSKAHHFPKVPNRRHTKRTGAPLVARFRWEYTSDAWNVGNGAHYALHCCPRDHGSVGGWKCGVRNDAAPPTLATRREVSQRYA